jgi:glycosyltransferase involved in cell wall biosynthesis
MKNSPDLPPGKGPRSGRGSAAATGLDVSVVVPFADDEDCVGALSRRIAEHLRALRVRFEIVAVDEDSRDNSVALLAYLRVSVPELRVIAADGMGHGFAAGARVARGRTLWLVDPSRAEVPLAPFGWARARIEADAADIVVVERRYLLCRRTRVWQVLDAIRGRGAVFERRFLRRATMRRLRVETPPRPVAAGRGAWLGRLLASLTPGAAARSRA